MSYIGKTPTIGNFQVCDAISVVNNQAAYTMQVGSVNVSPESANHMIVSLNGVIQKPTDAYTVSSSTITFASNLVTGDVIDFIQILGNVLDLGVPSDNTVTTAKLSDSSVSLAKLTATGTKDATTFLRGDNTFDTPVAGGITVAHQWRLTTSFATTSTVPIASNWEQVDTYGYGGIGTVMSESSGVFSFPSTGIYLINFVANVLKAGDTAYWKVRLDTTVDGSNYNIAADSHGGIKQVTGDTLDSCSANFMFDVTDVSTHKVRFGVEAAASTTYLGSTNRNQTFATFTRLGDT